ncbi:MAG: SPOR domain-containing protein [Bacteroidetes bacterium]|nr:SPOR domain-containing protein [Bacteroidota bacterium]
MIIPQVHTIQKDAKGILLPGKWILGLLFLAILVFTHLPAYSQEVQDYDEISVYLTVPRVGSLDISAAIRDEQAYLPINEIFDFLRIKNVSSPGMDSITGFFISTKSLFLIDYSNHKIVFQDKTTDIPPRDFIKTETGLYLKSNYFGQVFGLECAFSFRSLGVTLNTKLELPIIREMRLAEVRNNISKLKGEVKADTNIKRTYPLFHLGMADWSVISNQIINGRSDTRLNLALGAVLAGGEASASLIYNNNQPFQEKQQQYMWRFANNDFRYVKQIMAGKIATSATSSIYSPVVGVQATNAPTTFRRSFGSYTLTDKTEPGWTVELYVNNVLIDYVKADASGFFTFDVPLVYGNSAVLLKFYGPWGEEKTKEQSISIPFNFLPAGEMQYSASAGIVEDSVHSKFGRAAINYGASRRITIGAGTEYLSSVTSGTMMPYVSSSFRLASSLLFSGEYTYGVRKKAILTYRLPSNMQFEMYFTSYDKGQTAINYNYLQERKAVLSVPLRTKNFSAFTRLTLNQIILPETKYTTTELLLSGALYGVSTNITTYAMFVDGLSPYTYSNVSLSFRLPRGFVLIPQGQYEYNHNKLISLKCGVEKHVFGKGFVNLSYEQNFKSNIQNLEFGFRYDFSFAQTAFTARRVNKSIMMTQSARGGFIYDGKSRYLHASNRNGVGKGGLLILPFLDLNCNGKREPGEPKAVGLNIHANGGRIEKNDADTTIRIFDLEPYSNYYIEFDRNGFDNIAWQLKYNSMSVAIDPNQFHLLEVPISVLGEASGTVFLKGAKSIKGQGRIVVCFFNEAGKLAGRTLSETDGYFSFLGLPPGKYTARIDSGQLKKINMISSPVSLPFEMHKSVDGDVVDGLEFILLSTLPVTSEMKPAGNKETLPADKSVQTIKENSPLTIIAAKPVNPEPAQPNVKEKAENSPEKKETNVKPVEAAVAPAKQSEPVKDMSIVPSKTDVKELEKTGNSKTSETDKLVLKPLANVKRPLPGSFGIQIGAYSGLANAEAVRNRVVDALNKEVYVQEDNKLYKVIVTGFQERQEAVMFMPNLKSRGFAESFVIQFK